jgi:transposase-like protein
VVLIGVSETTEGRTDTMADDLRMGLEALLRKAAMDSDADFLRDGVRVLSQALLELEVSQHVGAERHERAPASATGIASGNGTHGWAASS